MKVYELFDHIDVQGDIRFMEYDHEAETLTEITREQASLKEIYFIYPRNKEIIIEVRHDE
jgi:hypothetical protein